MSILLNLKRPPYRTYSITQLCREFGATPRALRFYEEQGLAVLGFPANNFGGQEPGTNLQIAQFCKKNYGVTFQLFEKISVVGNDQHPLWDIGGTQKKELKVDKLDVKYNVVTPQTRMQLIANGTVESYQMTAG